MVQSYLHKRVSRELNIIAILQVYIKARNILTSVSLYKGKKYLTPSTTYQTLNYFLYFTTNIKSSVSQWSEDNKSNHSMITSIHQMFNTIYLLHYNIQPLHITPFNNITSSTFTLHQLFTLHHQTITLHHPGLTLHCRTIPLHGPTTLHLTKPLHYTILSLH